MKQKSHMPRGVSKKILDRCARNEPVVVVPRNGKPSRCFGVQEYQKMQQHPLKHRPWMRRRSAQAPDPLGALKLGGVRGSLRRENIYD